MASTSSANRCICTVKRAQRLLQSKSQASTISTRTRTYATAAAIAPAPSNDALNPSTPFMRYPPSQPPSYKRPEFRKTQLHRQYTSLLHSTPLILIFQHNNLTAQELMGIRRELAVAMRKVDQGLVGNPNLEGVGNEVKMQIIKSGIFAAALRVVEFFDRSGAQKLAAQPHHPSDPTVNSSVEIANSPTLTHGLSTAAWRVARNSKAAHGLEPLLSGPLLIVTMPTVSPAHLKQIFSILSPSPQYPAPKRKTNPSYHEPAVQSGLQKLMLLGARVEGKVFDFEGVRWVGSIEGGLDGLRAQLVHLLQGAAAGVTRTLESAGKNLYMTLESRKTMLGDGEKKPQDEAPPS